ncbi:MAG: RNA 2',3'-cyclic phosphodiesterase [Methylococcaceae bacterium]|jgi:RNA 2',3'-cyclic 3'-phosphodiesterase
MTNHPESSRLFFALWPDEQTRLKLVRLNQSIEAKGFKPVQPHNLHATLFFLGSVDSASELLLKYSVREISAKSFSLKFDQLSYWSKPNILCLTCSQASDEAELLVTALNREIASCGLQTDTRPYLPHITLARHAQYLPDIPIEPIVWRAEAFVLAESCSEPSGVNYKVKQQWPFINATRNK